VTDAVTQPSQEESLHDDEAVSSLLALASSPRRAPFASASTPFHSIVDSIVGPEANDISTSASHDRGIDNLYSLGLRNK
jgi:hypothetical protein